jgi:hypothetical protein
MNHTPDIRTRAILPRWACAVRINFIKPQLNERNLVELLAGAGLLCGIGDWRQEKGSGSYGQFRIADPDDEELAEIMQTGGREAQDAALTKPQCYDDETLKMLSWATEEIARRRKDGVKVARQHDDPMPSLPAITAQKGRKTTRKGNGVLL